MQDRELQSMADHEETYWWHVGRRHLVEGLIESVVPRGSDREVLDVGCGSGGNLGLLAGFGRVRGVEPAGQGLDLCRERGYGPEQVLEGRAEALPFGEASFDLVTALDVLEHLDDDLAGARELLRVLRPGGHLLMTVPAYRFLWSVHDEALGHRRRYMASEVHRLLNGAGFKVLRRTYAITFPLPAITAFRVAQGLIPTLYQRGASYVRLPKLLNRAMVGVLKLESALITAVDLPVGTSIVALARKP